MPTKKNRRYIRLKEWQPGIDDIRKPSPEYIASTDGSLMETEYRVRTDENGYILPPPIDNENCDRTIIFLGDSFVESNYVSEGERFVAGIHSRLHQAGIYARCLNGGYSGATTLHLLMAVLAKVGRSSATTIVLVVPSNDALALIKKGGYWCMNDRRYAPIVPVPDGVEAESQPLNLDDLRAVLNLFVDTCRRMRLELLLATFPHRTAGYENDQWLRRRFKNAANYARMLGWRESVNSVVRAVAKRLNLSFVDLEKLISTQTHLFYDDLHMNETGSRRVAEILCDFLLSRHEPAEIR